MKSSIIGLCLMIAVCVFSHVSAQQKSALEKSLSPKQLNLITISAFTAKGDLVQLQQALSNGLDAGLTINKIKEAIVHLYAYGGFPRSIRGLQTLMAVLDERKAKASMMNGVLKPLRLKMTEANMNGAKRFWGNLLEHRKMVPEQDMPPLLPK